MNYIKRQNKLLKLLESESLDALLIKKRENISYLVDTKGEDAILFISFRNNFLIAKPLYEEEYSKVIKNCNLRIVKDADINGCIEEVCKKTGSRHIGFESENFSYSEYADLKKKLKNRALISTKGMVEGLRMVKDNDEIVCIREACRYGCETMNYALSIVRPSFAESYVKGKIETFIINKGIKRADFDIIVASGKNASMPHVTASKKCIREKEVVVIDLGTMNCGYNSDLTRTCFLGRIERKYSRIYNIVLDAQKKAIEKIKPGVRASEIDHVARNYIIDKRLGRYFIHSLGHGIGLETHEGPRISQYTNVILEKHMIVTIEPGVYIPGWGGVRIEDVILLTDNGCEILTRSCCIGN